MFSAELESLCRHLGMECTSMSYPHHNGVTLSFVVIASLVLLSTVLFVASLLYHIIRTRQYISELNFSKKKDRNLDRLLESIGLAGKLCLVETKEYFAFTYGYLSPKVCISSGYLDNLSREELKAVLLHEKHHLMSRDPLKVLLLKSLSNVFFYIPVLGAWAKEYEVSRELTVDRKVIEEQGTNKKIGSALLKILNVKREIQYQTSFISSDFSISRDRVSGILGIGSSRRNVIPLRSIFFSLIPLIGVLGLFSMEIYSGSLSGVYDCEDDQKMYSTPKVEDTEECMIMSVVHEDICGLCNS